MPGSALFRVRSALLDQLDLDVLNVLRQSPAKAEDIQGPGSSSFYEAVWLEDEASAEHDIVVLTGGPQWIDENASQGIVIQVIGKDSSHTQEVVDERADELLGLVIALLADDPGLGIADDPNIQLFTVLPQTTRFVSGFLNTEARARRIVLDVAIHARLKLTTIIEDLP